MSMYMGKGETATAITEALEVLRKYPHQWITYNPNDPLANSVVTYLKKQGKVTVNRFHQFQAVPKSKLLSKYKHNPVKKSNRYYRLRDVAEAADKLFVRELKKQFPKERSGDVRYRSNSFNAATKKAAARMRKASDALSAFLRGR